MNVALFKQVTSHRILLALVSAMLVAIASGCASLPLVSSADTGAPGPATIAGRVLDDRGGIITDAKVRLTGPSFRRTVRTDIAGKFTFERVPLGRFVVSASAPGLKDAKQSIEVGQEATVKVELKLKLKM